MSTATMARREAEAAGMAPLTMADVPLALRAPLAAWMRGLHPGCAHVERGEFGLARMPDQRIMCPVHVALLDLDADPVRCSGCGAAVTGAPGTLAGYLAPTPTLWLVVAFCPTCTRGATDET